MQKQTQAIDSLLIVLGINGVMGSAMVMTAGWTTPVWLPLSAIAVGFVLLEQLLSEDLHI